MVNSSYIRISRPSAKYSKYEKLSYPLSSGAAFLRCYHAAMIPLLPRNFSTAPIRSLMIAVLCLTLLSCANPSRHTDRTKKQQTFFKEFRYDSVFEGDLEQKLQFASAEQSLTVLVDLSRQIDHEALRIFIRNDPRVRKDRRGDVIDLYREIAENQQRSLIPWLENARENGLITYWKSIVIVNRLIVEGSAEGLRALARRPEVARIRPDWSSDQRSGRQDPSSTRLGESFTSWALDAMGVPVLWDAGYRGKGVRVAAIDTGVAGGHEQFIGRMAEDDRGWFDPVEGRKQPWDSQRHGTGVLSVAVGGNPKERVIGVAPEATWSAALGNYNNFYSRVRMTLAADWIFRVSRPDVLINAWSHAEGACTDFDLPFIDAWKASGIFVIFPAGNGGPRAGSGESPAQLRTTFPDNSPVFSVGGLTPGGDVYRLSSRGPSQCGEGGFPLIAVPGEDLPHAFPLGENGYLKSGGTSFAAGLLGGAAALLLQAAPDLEPWELEALLIKTARDLRPEGTDADSGAGSIDLEAAFLQLKEEGRVQPPRP